MSTESETVDRTDKKTGSVVVSTEPETVDRTNSKTNRKKGSICGKYRTQRQETQQNGWECKTCMW